MDTRCPPCTAGTVTASLQTRPPEQSEDRPALPRLRPPTHGPPPSLSYKTTGGGGERALRVS